MTSRCDVEHVPPNDKASSPGEMTSRRSFPLGEGQWRRQSSFAGRDKEIFLKFRNSIYIYGKTIKVDVINLRAYGLTRANATTKINCNINGKYKPYHI